MIIFCLVGIVINNVLIGSSDRDLGDCRTNGCGKNAECIRDGAIFVCRCPPGTSGSPDIECTTGRKIRPTNFLTESVD